MTKLTGGCLCGATRYEVTGAPLRTTLCHCTHCQKASGSAFSVNIVVKTDDIAFSGAELARYADMPESGVTLRRLFCATCGSSIGSQSDARPQIFVLKAGSLDDYAAVRPTMQIWARSKQPWVDVPGLETHDKGL